MPEPAQKHDSSHFRPCRKIDINWDGFQFLCISLCQSLLESMTHPISDHAERLIFTETVFNFSALAYARACSKVWLVPSETMHKIGIGWDGLQFPYIILCWSLLKSMSYPISEHAEKLILAETVFNFYALACAGACSKVWLVPFQTMQKDWY